MGGRSEAINRDFPKCQPQPQQQHNTQTQPQQKPKIEIKNPHEQTTATCQISEKTGFFWLMLMVSLTMKNYVLLQYKQIQKSMEIYGN